MARLRRLATVTFVGAAALAVAGPAYGAFPGDNGRIAFLSNRDGNDEIYSARPDGSDPRNLTNNAASDGVPAYSPDGKRIAFTSDREDPNGEIYVMRADGSRVTRITVSPATFDFEPAWSPDGKRLVFSRAAPDTAPDLWVVEVGKHGPSGAPRNLTNSPQASDFEPAWSPDGRWIAFTSDFAEPDNIDVYDIRPNGRDQRRLTDAQGFDGGANYTPDGRRIGFDSERNSSPPNIQADIFVMTASGADETPLEVNPAFDILTGFSPDGRFITFTSDRDGEVACGPPAELSRCPDVFVKRARLDAPAFNITPNTPTFVEAEPDWQPRDDDDDDDDDDDHHGGGHHDDG
jgi:Tol biopolymer transport system component